MPTKENVALVAGVSGVTGRNLALQLEESGNWQRVYGSSRRATDFGKQIKGLPLDLSDTTSLARSLSETSEITHIFFCAYQSAGSAAKEVEINFTMFKGLVEAAEQACHKVQHVSFVSGTKWYGLPLGEVKTPMKEDDPRAMPPMFYYNMEDYCIDRKKAGCSWSWSSVRPNPVCGFSLGSVMNLTMTLAVYASICKHLNLPFRFPGSVTSYNILLEVVDVEILSKGMEWICLHSAASNTSYNISNGDIFRWSGVWPKIAAFFELEVARPQPFSLVSVMESHESTWQEIVRKHSLKQTSFKDVATWGFGDWVFAQKADWFTDVSKLRRAGFQEMTIDTSDMFLRQFAQLRKDGIIP